MKRNQKRPSTQLQRMIFDEGKSIEEVIRGALENPNSIEESAPPMFTERGQVLPECDIRTDKQLLAIEACDKFTKSKIAKTKGIELANKGEEKTETKTEKTEGA